MTVLSTAGSSGGVEIPGLAMASPRRLLLAGLCALLFLAGSGAAAERWTVLKDCRLIANPANDGDSFHVQAAKRHYIFRLYFVDAPEADDSMPKRTEEQAEYFDIKSNAVLKLGKRATAFATAFLKDGFTVYTRREDAMGRSDRKRYYAWVEANGRYLSEALVSNGLARVYGDGTDLPDGTSEKRCWRRLRGLERGAKRRGVGAWAKPRLRSFLTGNADEEKTAETSWKLPSQNAGRPDDKKSKPYEY